MEQPLQQKPDSTSDLSFKENVNEIINRILLEAYNKRIKTLELLIISISEAPQCPEVKNELIELINKILTYLRARPSAHPDTQLLVDWPF